MKQQNKALHLARKIIAQIVTDVVNLEDINYTVPEVQTLLDGITVGGHKLQDELITLNQINAWKFLFNSIETNTFSVSKEFILKLHNLVANQEALEWGVFRTGSVSISGTDYMPPKAIELPELWETLETKTNKAIECSNNHLGIYRIAINLFAEMARTQFFYDGNKRTARMIMSGVLLSHGLPMINTPATRKLEFNQIMIEYYNTQQIEPLYNFLLSCLKDWELDEFNLIPKDVN